MSATEFIGPDYTFAAINAAQKLKIKGVLDRLLRDFDRVAPGYEETGRNGDNFDLNITLRGHVSQLFDAKKLVTSNLEVMGLNLTVHPRPEELAGNAGQQTGTGSRGIAAIVGSGPKMTGDIVVTGMTGEQLDLLFPKLIELAATHKIKPATQSARGGADATSIGFTFPRDGEKAGALQRFKADLLGFLSANQFTYEVPQQTGPAQTI